MAGPLVERAQNGPIRQIPGTQNTREMPPPVASEPEWMKLSTVAPLKAGGMNLRDGLSAI